MAGAVIANCSILGKQLLYVKKITGKRMNSTYSDNNRIGDHIWYISDVSTFKVAILIDNINMI